MKKLICIFLSLVLLIACVPCAFAEEIEPDEPPIPDVIDENFGGYVSICLDGDQMGYCGWQSFTQARNYYGTDYTYYDWGIGGGIHYFYYCFDDGGRMYFGVIL